MTQVKVKPIEEVVVLDAQEMYDRQCEKFQVALSTATTSHEIKRLERSHRLQMEIIFKFCKSEKDYQLQKAMGKWLFNSG